MADSDFNIIKPVESLQNIRGLTPAQRRQERKRRRNAPAEHHDKEHEEEPGGTKNQPTSDDGDARSIDYCA